MNTLLWILAGYGIYAIVVGGAFIVWMLAWWRKEGL